MSSTASHQQAKTGTRILATAVLALSAFASAAGVWVAGAGTALAPEPAFLTQDLGGSTGTMASAYYANTSTPTNVIKWPGTWTAGSVAAGTPCSTFNLDSGAETTTVIVANGHYRKCM